MRTAVKVHESTQRLTFTLPCEVPFLNFCKNLVHFRKKIKEQVVGVICVCIINIVTH